MNKDILSEIDDLIDQAITRETHKGSVNRVRGLLKSKVREAVEERELLAREDENMQTRILAKLAYVQDGKSLDTAKLIEVLDEREAELKALRQQVKGDWFKGSGDYTFVKGGKS